MPALTPEQEAQIERAVEMLEGYAAHLYKLSPFNPDEHPYIPSIEEAAEEMRALLAQLEAAQADTDKLLSIIASAYQIAGAHDAPAHILDVLSDPEAATAEQVDAMLPYQPGLVQAVPDGWRDLIEWLLGKKGPFPTRNSVTEGLYWWRKELRARYEKLIEAMPGDPAQ